jgi:hypothetical protein
VPIAPYKTTLIGTWIIVWLLRFRRLADAVALVHEIAVDDIHCEARQRVSPNRTVGCRFEAPKLNPNKVTTPSPAAGIFPDVPDIAGAS